VRELAYEMSQEEEKIHRAEKVDNRQHTTESGRQGQRTESREHEKHVSSDAGRSALLSRAFTSSNTREYLLLTIHQHR
jgi:hypothetical protein